MNNKFAFIPHLSRFLVLEENGISYLDKHGQHWGVDFLKMHHPETVYLDWFFVEDAISESTNW